MKRQQEDTRRAVEEVPLLTEIVAHDETAVAPGPADAEKALAADIERVMLVRLVPEVNKQIASLRAELEKGLRRSVREAPEIDGTIAIPTSLEVGSFAKVRVVSALGPDCTALHVEPELVDVTQGLRS